MAALPPPTLVDACVYAHPDAITRLRWTGTASSTLLLRFASLAALREMMKIERLLLKR